MPEKVYVLQLNKLVDGYPALYVGRTQNVARRVREHATGSARCAKWVSRNGGVKQQVRSLIGSEAAEQPESWEEKETVAAMLAHPHGYACVRGWEFVNPVLSPADYCAIKCIALGAGDLCRTCGAAGHYANSSACKKTPQAWLAACNKGIVGETPRPRYARKHSSLKKAVSKVSERTAKAAIRRAANATVDMDDTDNTGR